MSDLTKEIRNVRNPALGAYLIWNFVRGYYEDDSNGVPIPLLFIILPILFREDLTEILNSTNRPSGLRKFADKFLNKAILKNDVIYNIHISSKDMRELSLSSIKIAISANLISIDSAHALALPIISYEHNNEYKSVKQLGNASKKLGHWCSNLTLFEVSQILKVRF